MKQKQQILNTTMLSSETGRSMVEMLGTLAIIGVLSVSGIAGYTYAMNKHRANEIIASVSKMAMTATTEIDLRGQPSLVEFKNLSGKIMTDGGYEVELTPDNGDGTFTLTVKNVPEDVCEKITAMNWKLPYEQPESCSSGDNNMAFIFTDSLDNNDSGNNDEPNTDPAPSSTPVSCTSGGSECSGCQTCQDGVCKDNNASCGTDGVCTNGRCTNCPKGDACGTQCCADGTYCAKDGSCVAPGGTNSCTKNSDCASDGSQYCKFTSGNCSGPTNGTCTSKGTLTEVSYNGHTFYASADYMTWWAAENLCLAHGKHLASLGSLGLSTSYTGASTCTTDTCTLNENCKKYSGYCLSTDTDEECIRKGCGLLKNGGPLYQAGLDGGYWTSNSYPDNSCGAYDVGVGSGSETVRIKDRYIGASHALCE